MTDLKDEGSTSFSVRRLNVPAPRVRTSQDPYEKAVPDLPLERVRELVAKGAPWSAMVVLAHGLDLGYAEAGELGAGLVGGEPGGALRVFPDERSQRGVEHGPGVVAEHRFGDDVVAHQV